MDFLTAIRHAFAGYAIRRKSWPENRSDLIWDSINDCFIESGGENAFEGVSLIYLKDLSVASIFATDWEAT